MIGHICPECRRCDCGAGPFTEDRAADHVAMHRGQAAVHEHQQPSTPLPADPHIGELSLMVRLNDAWDDGEGEPVYRRTQRQLEAVCRYVDNLHGLIRWLALPYFDEPLWSSHNQYGQELPDNAQLRETWRGVIGPLPE